MFCALDQYESVVNRTSCKGQIYGVFTGQIFACDAVGASDDFINRALCHNFTAVDACAGAYIYDIVRFTQGLFVVLYNDEGVAKITESFQGFQQFLVVPLVEPYAGLVKDIQDACQSTSYLSCKADTLAFTTAEG